MLLHARLQGKANAFCCPENHLDVRHECTPCVCVCLCMCVCAQVNAVPYDQLPSLDKFMLSRIAALQTEVAAAYDSYAFNKIFGALQRFVAQDCSSFYLDVAKDRCV